MTQEFVTLPREVVEQALEALINEGEFRKLLKPLIEKSIDSIRAALEQPQDHVPDAGNMVPAGWKLVPVDPTEKMIDMGRGLSSFPNGVYRAMLSAAPKPPTVKDSLTVEQPQADQPAMTPIAQRKLEDLVASGYTISGYSVYHEQRHQHGFVTGAGLVGWWKPEGVEYPQPRCEQEPVGFVRQIDIEQIAKTPSDWGAMFGRAMGFNTVPVYTNPQPKREPLTDEKIEDIWRDNCYGYSHDKKMDECGFLDAVRAVEIAHNIK